MLSTALSLAILTTAGCIAVYQKLPRKIRRVMEKYSLMTDLLALVAVYALFGGTLTALFAGAMCGIFISILLHISNNPEDFLFLYDLHDFMKSQIKEAQGMLSTYSATYRQRKLHEVESIPA